MDSNSPAFHKEVTHLLSQITPNFLVLVDDKRRILYANNSLLAFAGCRSLDQIAGKRFGEAIRCDHQVTGGGDCGTMEHCGDCPVNRALGGATDGAANNEITLRNDAGQSRVFRVLSHDVDMDGARGVAVILQDISDSKRREILERLFFHDFLNAAAGITGLLEMIEMQDADPGQNLQMLRTARSCADYLVDEINYFRALTLAENKTLVVNNAPIGFDAIAERIKGFFYMLSDKGGVSIEVKSTSRREGVVTDNTLILRVLINLVKNAVEASARGSVVRLVVSDCEGGVLFEVHNDAVIPAGMRDNVFIRSHSTKGKGRGNGTYSVRLFAEYYLGGKVWFKSEEGFGTSFYVFIPQAG
jgi:signal transduction histidine kinase